MYKEVASSGMTSIPSFMKICVGSKEIREVTQIDMCI
jgi:hypothetical protein